MSKKVIIIGAGLTGLSAGIHLQSKGIQTEIFELSGQAGGMCLAWFRSGYRFDGCVHWMVGTKAGDPIYQLYREVDALGEDTPIYNTESLTIEINTKCYEIPLKLEPFQKFLLALAPEDSDMIQNLCRNVQTMISTKMPFGTSGLSGFISMLTESRGFLKLAIQYGKQTVGDYTEKFRNLTIKSILYHLMPAHFGAITLFMMLGVRMSGNAGYPLGGASDVIKRMEGKYRSLGGSIQFNSKVDEILVSGGKAIGIRSKGKTHSSDVIIAACDAFDTLKRMLKGKYKHEQLDTMLQSASLFQPISIISFGLDRRFDIPFSIDFECPEGIRSTPNYTINNMSVHAYDFDSTAAPVNGSSVMVLIPSQLDYWQTLRNQDIIQYRKEKNGLAQSIADLLDKRYPGFKKAIQVTDVATPATYVRYANLYKGAWEGFEPTPDVMGMNIKNTIKGIKDLYIAGQWTTPGGGICNAVLSGKQAAERIIGRK